MQILTDAVGNVLVRLREGSIVAERLSEVIVDLNQYGNWIRGFEVVGGMVDFSLKAATAPFSPSTIEGVRVAYDPEADAAFFYLPYGRSFSRRQGSDKKTAEVYSHSVNPLARYQLDENSGLVSIVIPTADVTKGLAEFLALFDYEPGGIFHETTTASGFPGGPGRPPK